MNVRPPGFCKEVGDLAAQETLTAFEASEWGLCYLAISQSWRRAWTEVIRFFAFPDEVSHIGLVRVLRRSIEIISSLKETRHGDHAYRGF